jgi:hypothetical protein
MSGATTDRTTSHLNNPAKIAGQVIDETTSHLTKAASCQVIGYVISAPLANYIGQQLVQLPTVKYGKIAAAHFRPNPSFSR